MNPAWSLAFAALVPFLCLGLLLGLARLEDTLTDGLEVPAKPRPAKQRPAEAVARTEPAATPALETVEPVTPAAA
jgi:hypothetical protein